MRCRTRRMFFSLALALCATGLLAGDAAAGISSQWWRSQREREEWLKSEHEKVTEDSKRLVELTGDLRDQALAPEQESLTPALQERIQTLVDKAKELREGVETMDVNMLSLDVIEGAHAIREEAKSLKRLFERSPAKRALQPLRKLTREIEKRADSIYDRTRHP